MISKYRSIARSDQKTSTYHIFLLCFLLISTCHIFMNRGIVIYKFIVLCLLRLLVSVITVNRVYMFWRVRPNIIHFITDAKLCLCTTEYVYTGCIKKR